MKRPVLTFGILSGAVIFGYSMILFLIYGDIATVGTKNLQMMEMLGFLRYLILLLGIVMAVIAYRRGTSGPIGYKRAFLTGFYTASIIALFVGMMEFVYVAFLDPNFYEHYGALMLEVKKQAGAPAAELAALQQEMQTFSWIANPWMTGIFYIGLTAVAGTIIALITAIFGRRKDGPSFSGAVPIDQPA
jgi:Protein of unknown function (DUF4199)